MRESVVARAWPDIDSAVWPDIDDKAVWPEIDEAWPVVDELIASAQPNAASKAHRLEAQLSELLQHTEAPLRTASSAYTVERLKVEATERALQVSSKAVGDMLAARMEVVDAADAVLREAGAGAALLTPRGILLGKLEALRVTGDATMARLVDNARFELMLAVDELAAEADVVFAMSNREARLGASRFLSVLNAATAVADTAAHVAANSADASQDKLRSATVALVHAAAGPAAWALDDAIPKDGTQLTEKQLQLRSRLAAARLERCNLDDAGAAASPQLSSTASSLPSSQMSVRSDGKPDEAEGNGPAAAPGMEQKASAKENHGTLSDWEFLSLIERSAAARHAAEDASASPLSAEYKRHLSDSPGAVKALRAIVLRLQDLNLDELIHESLHAAGLVDDSQLQEQSIRSSESDSDFSPLRLSV